MPMSRRQRKPRRRTLAADSAIRQSSSRHVDWYAFRGRDFVLILPVLRQFSVNGGLSEGPPVPTIGYDVERRHTTVSVTRLVMSRANSKGVGFFVEIVETTVGSPVVKVPVNHLRDPEALVGEREDLGNAELT